MTDVVSTESAGQNLPPGVPRRRNLHMLAGVRAEKLTGLILPPGHERVLDVAVLIWVDGVEAGMQMIEPSPQSGTIGLTDDLAESLYDELESAGFCSEYDEFPELDDPDFQDLAYGRVAKLGKMAQPIGHPEVTWDMVEIWTDGVAAALRVARDRAQRSA
ncbi:hypothetical protein ABW16_02215 [Mycolicibacter heraklionensis]|uniref:Uncharacterized protein n=1 Tax=Mycolicibacter heraklionensis TaxID=512402 RepID=A0A9X7WI28_9MYCO|nr:hypothetical protein [Mycolicibacter heraklionensis]KLO31658.1 hypothetical protein ABW16_02215 [Mycolicibacter heraklionensis]QZA08640.1 hypothetical protein K3U94_04930 [Mycolicibacter heraklionensis]